MMDTILNLGLNEATAAGLAAPPATRTSRPTACAGSGSGYRAVIGADGAGRSVGPAARRDRGRVPLVERRARGAYRRREGIPDDLGTAVTVQAMVFGNRGADSGTGVLFTRNPSTGEPGLYGDVLFDAQGEDVVAGTPPPEPIAVLDDAAAGGRGRAARHAERARAPLRRHVRHRVHDRAAAGCGCSRCGSASAVRAPRCVYLKGDTWELEIMSQAVTEVRNHLAGARAAFLKAAEP